MEKQTVDELPKWFRISTRIALHCSWGITALFLLLKITWITKDIDKTFIQWVNIFLILIAIPSYILAGPQILKILKAIKNDDSK